MSKRNKKVTLKQFIESFNKRSNFKSWAVITTKDYEVRMGVPNLNDGNSIVCINTSTSDTMKYMLLAHYLIVRNIAGVSFTYVWSGYSKEVDNIREILADMANVFKRFMWKSYSINSSDYFRYSEINEELFNKKLDRSVDLREIYYEDAPDNDSSISSVPSISLNIAKSIAKPGTLIASTEDSIVVKARRQRNTHTDNMIKGFLSNPSLINVNASYNENIPLVKIKPQTITLSTRSRQTLVKEPVVLHVNMNEPRPAFNMGADALISFVMNSDIIYKDLIPYGKIIEQYYTNKGISTLIRMPGNKSLEHMQKYIVGYVTGDDESAVFNTRTDDYVFVSSTN